MTRPRRSLQSPKQGNAPVGAGPDAVHAGAEANAGNENEQAIRELTARLINAQEAERSHLARELHDDFSQRVALLAVQLHMLKQSPAASAELRKSVDALYAEVQALGKDLRRLSHDLHPARLEQLGLVSALRQLCGEVSTAHGLAVTCEAREVPHDVPEALALCLYRVTQEALQNVVKHSGALEAHVELVGVEAELHLVVGDEGRGFDPAAARRTGSLGLVNMRERVRLVAGRFEIRSAPGQGTRIDVWAEIGGS